MARINDLQVRLQKKLDQSGLETIEAAIDQLDALSIEKRKDLISAINQPDRRDNLFRSPDLKKDTLTDDEQIYYLQLLHQQSIHIH